jgi:hypothetical protein
MASPSKRREMDVMKLYVQGMGLLWLPLANGFDR